LKIFTYLSVFATLIFILSAFTIQDAHATSTTFTTNTIITSDQTISSGDAWIVNPSVVLTINPGVQIIVESSGTIANFGTIANSGNIANSGSFVNNPSGLFNNDGSITNTGFFLNNSTINNNSGGIIDNQLILINDDTTSNSGIINNFCGGTYLGSISGNPVRNMCDTDGDGIVNSIDTQPNVFSNDFSDGTTFGTILTRGSQVLTISDEPNPAGVRIKADPSGGVTPAQVSTCGGAVIFSLNAGDEIVKTGCTPDPITVITGPVDATLTGTGGSTGTTTLGTGFTLSFDPSTFTFSAPLTNPGPVTINTGGNTISIPPGGSIQQLKVSIDIKPDQKSNTINIQKDKFQVALFGSSSFDVKTVDKSTLRFGGHTIQPPMKIEFDKVNKDKFLDLEAKFNAATLGFSIGDTQGCLTGKLLNGVPFMGCDSVKIISK
jgi:hypothetical protein